MKDNRTKATKVSGTAIQPNKIPLTTATNNKITMCRLPVKVLFLSLLLIIGKLLTINQLNIATMAYKNHLLVSTSSTQPCVACQ